jgi:hypothetical protein
MIGADAQEGQRSDGEILPSERLQQRLRPGDQFLRQRLDVGRFGYAVAAAVSMHAAHHPSARLRARFRAASIGS